MCPNPAGTLALNTAELLTNTTSGIPFAGRLITWPFAAMRSFTGGNYSAMRRDRILDME